MRLALKVGRLDWRAALRELSPQEFIEWMAFERVEPFGQEWHQASMMTAAIVNQIRQIAAGIGGRKLDEDDYEHADAYVPGAAERRAQAEAKKTVSELKGLIGL
jgi:hypothetical protein